MSDRWLCLSSPWLPAGRRGIFSGRGGEVQMRQNQGTRGLGFPPERQCADIILRGPDHGSQTLPGKTSDTLRRSEIPATTTAPQGKRSGVSWGTSGGRK